MDHLPATPNKLNWTNTLFFGGLTLGALVLPPLYIYYHGISWPLVALFVGYMYVTGIGITAGYHRCLSHRSFESHPVLKATLLLFGAGAFQGSALEWATDHRQHHRNVDTEKDPYNINQGFFYAHIGWILWQDAKKPMNFPRDLTEDRMVMWQHRYYYPLAIFMSFGVPTLIGWSFGAPLGGLILGGILRQFTVSNTTFFINSWAHTFGRRPYSTTQTARDSLILAFMAFGEGYHNYHHQFASDYRNGIRWYQWDPTKWLIWACHRVGLASRLKRIPQTEILRARLRCDQQRLVSLGVPADQLQALKVQVESAQKRMREMRENYVAFKANLKRQSRERLDEVRVSSWERWEAMRAQSKATRIHLKTEWKKAKLEFKAAAAQWSLYIRVWRAEPSAQLAFPKRMS